MGHWGNVCKGLGRCPPTNNLESEDFLPNEIVSFVFPADSFAVIVILFGVSGAGKTTLGQLLAGELGWKFYEGDDFHSQANIDKMHAGVPLTDEDRQPWLESLRGLIERSLAAKENAVLTCSALKKSYRGYLRVNEQVEFVYLRGSYELVANRLRQRRGHFMNPELLRSQFATLEEPEAAEGVIAIELGRSPHELVDEIKKKLRFDPSQTVE
jgi:gluconokinase